MTPEESVPGITRRLVGALEQARPLCPDHRDKQRGKPCLACRIEQLERALAFYANRDNWRSSSESLDLRTLDPEYVSGKSTGRSQSGIRNGWEVAERALKGAS